MKILHLVNTLERGNGITNVVVDLACAQADHGDEVHVASLGGYYVDLIRNHGVLFHEINFTRESAMQLLVSLRQLASLIQTMRPDLIHVHTMTPLLLCKALFIHIPIIATIHNEWQRSSVLMRLASLSVGVSKFVTSSMIKRGIPPKQMRTVWNGVVGSPRKMVNDHHPQLVLAHPAILFVGAISRRKGTDILLRAYAIVREHIPQVHLYLVGNDHLGPSKHLFLNDTQMQNVHLIPVTDPYPYYRAADIFVLPSRTEPLGLVMLEAMECGLPVVGAQVGGIKEVLQDRGFGLTFPAENYKELARILIQVLTSESVKKNLQKQAQRAAETFTVEEMRKQYSSTYQDAIQLRRRPRNSH